MLSVLTSDSYLLRDLNHLRSGTHYIANSKAGLAATLISKDFITVFLYRTYSWLWRVNLKILSILLYQMSKFVVNCDISPEATIGPGFVVRHASDIVIGPRVIIGDNCVVFNGVTIGNKDVRSVENHMATIRDNVIIGTGAKILGAVEIGDSCIIGANSVVVTSFCNGQTIAGVPAKGI